MHGENNPSIADFHASRHPGATQPRYIGGESAWYGGVWQETKALPEQLTDELLHPLGYHAVWHPAEKKGYSGVATFSRKKPRAVRLGLGRREFDLEGRVLVSDFPGFVLINAYFHNSHR